MGTTQSEQTRAANPEQNPLDLSNQLSDRSLYSGIAQKRSKIFQRQNSQKSLTLGANIFSKNDGNVKETFGGTMGSNVASSGRTLKEMSSGRIGGRQGGAVGQSRNLCRQVKVDLDKYILSYIPKKKAQSKKELKLNSEPSRPSPSPRSSNQFQEAQVLPREVGKAQQLPKQLRNAESPQLISLKGSLNTVGDGEQGVPEIKVNQVSRANIGGGQPRRIELPLRGSENKMLVLGNSFTSTIPIQQQTSTNEMYQIQKLVSLVDP